MQFVLKGMGGGKFPLCPPPPGSATGDGRLVANFLNNENSGEFGASSFGTKSSESLL